MSNNQSTKETKLSNRCKNCGHLIIDTDEGWKHKQGDHS